MRKDFKRVDAIGYRPGRVATLGDFTERWKHERHLSGNALKIYNLLWRLCKKSRTGTVALSNRRIAQLIEARCDGKRADYITRIKMALARSC